ncbi:stage II sporulation protein M [Clostridium sp. E02]|uniref:stage II sporulation protein M n=1 Tax=Clostridium sp. E02 TaxID=2487134 RepID=UPI000F54A9DE|nr:stage II sporulation protein M [Clostridium sp. E02]
MASIRSQGLKGFQWQTGKGNVQDRYLFFFFAGLAVGTVLANFWYPSFINQATYYLGLLDQNATLSQEQKGRLFGQVLRQRGIQVFVAWLIGLTAYAVPLFCILTASIGFSMGFVLSLITVQKGLMGLPVFILTVFPQCLCYLPALVLLLFWGTQKEKRFPVLPFFILVVLTVAGSMAEAWMNPYFLKIVF